MGLSVYTAPASEPITRAEAKLHLRVDTDFTDDDALIDSLIVAARRQAEAETGRAFVSTVFDLTLDDWPCNGVIELPKPPLVSVTHVKYVDSTGTLTTLTVTTDYATTTSGVLGRIGPAYGVVWPTLYGGGTFDNVQVRFTGGYGAASAVPDDLKAAIKLILGGLYEHREDFITGTIVTPIPLAAERLLGFYRVPTVLVAA